MRGADGLVSNMPAASEDTGAGVLRIRPGEEIYRPDATASTPESTGPLPPAREGASVISR